jgi:hypothetical protein
VVKCLGNPNFENQIEKMKKYILPIFCACTLLMACGESSESEEGSLERSDKYKEIVDDAPLPNPEITAIENEQKKPTVTNMEGDPAPVNTPDYPLTNLAFDAEVHDFGTINQGDVVSHTFTVTNTGDEPLIISNCKGSCGCTVPVCPQEPIMPGESGEIPVEYNSEGKEGLDTKTVTVTANTEPGANILTIKVNTLVPGEES